MPDSFFSNKGDEQFRSFVQNLLDTVERQSVQIEKQQVQIEQLLEENEQLRAEIRHLKRQLVVSASGRQWLLPADFEQLP